jgi:hypothetical protein
MAYLYELETPMFSVPMNFIFGVSFEALPIEIEYSQEYFSREFRNGHRGVATTGILILMT